MDAASNSKTLNEAEDAKERQDSHSLHASPSGVRLEQLIVFANIRAQVVFPTPRGPQNKNACPNCCFTIAFFNVVVIALCPTTVEKF